MATVLIVDDDRFTRSVLQSIFGQDPTFRGHRPRVVTAGGGAEGLEVFRAHRPDVVISDLLMPEMDGFAVCEAIRAEPGGNHVHLVVMSGVYGDASTTRRLRDGVGATFFAKPYQLRELTRHVARVLGGQPGDEPSEPEITVEAAEGDLAEHPLPTVLLDLYESRATGALEIRRGRVRKSIRLLYGHIVGASSSIREETLGHFLVGRGLITDAQQRAAIKRAAEHGERVGEALIAGGALTPEQLVEQLTAQVRHKVTQSLRWPEGDWRFVPRPGDQGGAHGNAVDTAHVVLSGLYQTASSASAPPTVARIERDRLFLNERGRTLVPILRQVCKPLTDAWRQGITPRALGQAGVDRADLYAMLDALVLAESLRTEPSQQRAPSPQEDTLSVTELSEHSQIRRLPQLPEEETEDELYSMLFDDAELTGPGGQEPLDLGDGVPGSTDPTDSGYIDVSALRGQPGEHNAARRMLLEEYLRIQGLDHYEVLMVPRDADPAAISAAVVERRKKFSMDFFARFDLGRDHAKLEEIHVAYDRAFQVLLDDTRRTVYDQELSGGEQKSHAPSLDAELGFRTGEELLERGEYAAATRRFEAAVQNAPNEADYRAGLGWAKYLQGGRSGSAADTARQYLNQALAINPDHGRAHEYKGIIGAELGTDDIEAIMHLERALELDPGRTEALETLERLWRRRGELRPLEQQLRRLIYKTAGRDTPLEVKLWRDLGELYRELDEPEDARVAFESAMRLVPGDPDLQAILADLTSDTGDRFHERSEMLRSHWRRDPNAPGPGRELMRAALQAGRPDAAFMAASALVARGHPDDEAQALYRRHRPRFVIRAQRTMDESLWALLRHRDDSSELGAIFDLLAPVIHQTFPLSLYDLEIDEGMEVPADERPESFARVCSYVGHMLGVAVPQVFVRPDFGREIHIGATEVPVLLVGDDVLRSPERSELAFRIGRAMTYLRPGRVVGGSRPARLLKACLLAAYADARPRVHTPDPDGRRAELRELVTALPRAQRSELAERVVAITERQRSLNLSAWMRALGASADRMGMLLCGDLPAAARFARDSTTGEAIEDLIDYGVSRAHLELRTALGLSVDV